MYIIDSKIFFCPKSSKISPADTELFSKQLTTPGSRILEGLIQSNGEILSYEQLYQIGWGDNHVNIKPNTLYQNLSMLRRAFDDCGIDGKRIITHPRKGVSLKSENIVEHEKIIVSNRDRTLHNHSPPVSDSQQEGKSVYNSVGLLLFSLVLTPAVLALEILNTVRIER